MYLVKTNHIPIYSYVVTLFLYSTLLIDLYRKLVGANVGVVRNIIYIIALLLILWDAIKTKRIYHMIIVGGGMTLLYFLSSFVYPQHGEVYVSAWFLFVSRLWPAYYVGRYTDDWKEVSYIVRKFIWIAVIYAVLAFTASVYDSSGENSTYATIATNLFYIVWIALYDSINSKKVVYILLCLFCLIPVLFLGTRTCLFGSLLAFAFYFSKIISRSKARKKLMYYMLLSGGGILAVVFFTSFADILSTYLPNSRTVNLLISGEILNDSNRSDSFYSFMLQSLQQTPLKMYGIVGNQIWIAGENASTNDILSSFAHNIYLEFCMNFGLVIGLGLCFYFTIALFRCYLKTRWVKRDLEFVFIGVFGMTFVNMMLSFSWVFFYEVWLFFGLMYSVLRKRQAQF